MKKFALLSALLIFTHLSFSQIIFHDGFEFDNTNETPPTGWVCDANGWLAGEGIQSHGREPYNGDWYTYLKWDSDHWMYKQIDLIAGETYEFSMWYKTDGNTGFSMEVKWGIEGDPSMMQNEIFPLTAINNDSYQELKINFVSTETGVFFLGIHGMADNSPWYLNIDETKLKIINDYEFIINRLNPDTLIYAGDSHDYLVEIINTGLSEDEINLEATSEEDWDVEFYYKDGSGPITSISLQSFEKDTIIFRQMVPATGVDFGQIGETITSFFSVNSGLNSSKHFLSTILTVYHNYPLTEDFEDELFPPIGWDANIENGNKNYERSTEGEWPTCIPHDNSIAMAYYNSFSAQATYSALLISPELDLSASEYIVRFWFYRTDNIDNRADKVEIYLSDDIELSNAELLGSIHRTISMEPVETTEGWFEYSFTYTGNTNNKYIVFRAFSDYGWNMYIDDIKINENVADEEAPEFVSINELIQYADLELPVEIVIRDESDVTETMQGIYNVGNGEEFFELSLVGKSKGDHHYTGNIPAQVDQTTGTVKFIMEDIYGNSAETDLFDISWTGIAPLFEESFEDEFLPNGWTQIMQPYTWFVWSQVDEENYTDSDGIEYVVSPPDGEYQAMVGWDYQENKQDEWLISPEVEITHVADLTFETFAQLGSYDYDHFIVAISTNGGAWEDKWDAFFMDNRVIQYDETISIPLDNYLGQSIKVAWRAYNQQYDNLWYSWFIDDVKIEKRLNVSIDENINNQSFGFTILQNPFSNQLKIGLQNLDNDKAFIKISDMTGRTVLVVKTQAGEHHVLLNTTELKKGVYICTVTKKGIQKSKRIIKF
jgi:hypothetical protein